MIEKLDYAVTRRTIALVPAKHPYYQSIVFDERGTFLSTQRIEDLMKEGQLISLDGQTGSAILAFTDTEPLAFHAFSTMNPDEEKGMCMWIFPAHIEKTVEFDTIKVIFQNGERLKTNCPKERFECQWKKIRSIENIKKTI
ncbi:competence protein ComK [Bacillus sp. 1P06AnD]|uniref:competence protein ComK n=1 Tax=Bacillus sp. 1P06AnD TaxID=3132208 RepID=UPI00399EF94A